MNKHYVKEFNAIEALWAEYVRMFDPDCDLPLEMAGSPELYNLDLTLAMFGSARDCVLRRRKEIQILKEELRAIESAQREAMRFLPTNEETVEFFRPLLAECAEAFV